jgi:hypothetical protein
MDSFEEVAATPILGQTFFVITHYQIAKKITHSQPVRPN